MSGFLFQRALLRYIHETVQPPRLTRCSLHPPKKGAHVSQFVSTNNNKILGRNYSASGKQPNRNVTFCSFTVDKLVLFKGAHADAAPSWFAECHLVYDAFNHHHPSYGSYSYHTPYNSFYVVLDAFGYKSKSLAALLFERSEYHLVQHQVEVEFADGSVFHLSAEFLRIYSPAADSKIRSVGGEKVVFGRRHVGIMSAEPIGNYGIRIVFDDLHKTGIYTWDYFYHLGSNKFSLMRNYIKTLKKHGLSRDPQRRK